MFDTYAKKEKIEITQLLCCEERPMITDLKYKLQVYVHRM